MTEDKTKEEQETHLRWELYLERQKPEKEEESQNFNRDEEFL